MRKILTYYAKVAELNKLRRTPETANAHNLDYGSIEFLHSIYIYDIY